MHHALAEMVTAVLTPLIRRDMPLGPGGRALSQRLRSEWAATMLKLRQDIGAWVNKHNKHIPVRCTCPGMLLP